MLEKAVWRMFPQLTGMKGQGRTSPSGLTYTKPRPAEQPWKTFRASDNKGPPSMPAFLSR